jgi:hypothetical protein
MLLITIFMELHVVARRCRTRAGSPQAISTAMLCCGLEKNGMVKAGHRHGMESVNHTQLQCVNQMGKTHSKPLVARHGRGTAWAWHAMCELAFRDQCKSLYQFINWAYLTVSVLRVLKWGRVWMD